MEIMFYFSEKQGSVLYIFSSLTCILQYRICSDPSVTVLFWKFTLCYVCFYFLSLCFPSGLITWFCSPRAFLFSFTPLLSLWLVLQFWFSVILSDPCWLFVDCESPVQSGLTLPCPAIKGTFLSNSSCIWVHLALPPHDRMVDPSHIESEHN